MTSSTTNLSLADHLVNPQLFKIVLLPTRPTNDDDSSTEDFSDWSGVHTPTSSASAVSELSTASEATVTVPELSSSEPQTFHVHSSLLRTLSPRLAEIVEEAGPEGTHTLHASDKFAFSDALKMFVEYAYSNAYRSPYDKREGKLAMLRLHARVHALAGYFEIEPLYISAYDNFTNALDDALTVIRTDEAFVDMLSQCMDLQKRLVESKQGGVEFLADHHDYSLVRFLSMQSARRLNRLKNDKIFLDLARSDSAFFQTLLTYVSEQSRVVSDFSRRNPRTPCCGMEGGFGTFNLFCNVCKKTKYYGPEGGN